MFVYDSLEWICHNSLMLIPILIFPNKIMWQRLFCPCILTILLLIHLPGSDLNYWVKSNKHLFGNCKDLQTERISSKGKRWHYLCPDFCWNWISELPLHRNIGWFFHMTFFFFFFWLPFLSWVGNNIHVSHELGILCHIIAVILC